MGGLRPVTSARGGQMIPGPAFRRRPRRAASLLLLREPATEPAEEKEHHRAEHDVDREDVPGVLGVALVVEPAVEGGVGDAAHEGADARRT